jgi:hypothetical protein
MKNEVLIILLLLHSLVQHIVTLTELVKLQISMFHILALILCTLIGQRIINVPNSE